MEIVKSPEVEVGNGGEASMTELGVKIERMWRTE